MKIKYSKPLITLTGADDSIPHEALWHLAEKSDVGSIEWGILYSATQQGVGRYPSFKWIEELAETIRVAPGPSFALHVCGRAVRDFLAGSGHVTEVASAFNRIQLNFRSSEYAIEEIRPCLRRNGLKTIITQRNDANRDLWKALKGFDNHAVLFDKSGGRGQSPEEGWAPFWVDMEGKLRNEHDRFDIERAARCLEIAGQYERKYVVDEFFAKQGAKE